MRLTFRIFLLAIRLASLLGAGAASAGTLVEFPNLPGHTPANLSGYLARPDSGLSAELGGPSNSGAPYPAVVVLHGCNGMFGHSAVIADRLSSWGYVTVAVDSLGPRVIGVANRCGRGLPDQAFDAYAALRYLSQLDFVDPARVAVLGQSMGGETALHAVDHDPAAQFFTERFRAVIACYPYCDIPAATMTAPTLILIGEADETNPVEQCREMVAHARPDGPPIALTVYRGVHHNFDVALLTPGVRYQGFWLEYNEPAAKDAKKRRAHSSTLISPRHLPASRRQSDPMWAKRFLIAALAAG
jgi:dienelactone hydrolase